LGLQLLLTLRQTTGTPLSREKQKEKENLGGVQEQQHRVNDICMPNILEIHPQTEDNTQETTI
jgi:hypothetical protein